MNNLNKSERLLGAFLIMGILLFYGNVNVQSQSIVDHKVMSKAIKVADVWSGHPVGFDILTSSKYQYVAYYDADQNMCIAQRELASDQWEVSILPTKVGWDSHNRIEIDEDRDGFIHVSGNMHVVPLIYFRSTRPHSIQQFEKMDMVGTEEDRVTYPVFFKNIYGDLFFQYRNGGSGNGITYINRYDHKSKKWSRVLSDGLFDGEGETNAYPTGPIQGKDGYFHYMWVWRLNPIANTNHNLSYVRTRDFINYENISAEEIEIPIKYRERKVIADPVGPWNGLMNAAKILSFDSKGEVVLGYHKFDKEGRSQLFLCKFQDGAWIRKQISDWQDFTWDINKSGSLESAIELYQIKAGGDGFLYVGYRHKLYGVGILKVNEETFALAEDMRGQELLEISGLPTIGKSELLLHKQLDDSGNYMLQWQTLPRNFDRPRDPPFPQPEPLLLFEFNKS